MQKSAGTLAEKAARGQFANYEKREEAAALLLLYPSSQNCSTPAAAVDRQAGRLFLPFHAATPIRQSVSRF